MGQENEGFEGALQTKTSLLYLTDRSGNQPPQMVLKINDRLTVVELTRSQLAGIVADGAIIIARRSRIFDEEPRK